MSWLPMIFWCRTSELRFHEEATMKTGCQTKLVREGDYVAEVEVELIETDEGWSPYLSLDDAEKLDTVREALRQGEIEKASRLAHVYRLMPVAV
jgi:hypothetical protein